jgi:hypothetical protein
LNLYKIQRNGSLVRQKNETCVHRSITIPRILPKLELVNSATGLTYVSFVWDQQICEECLRVHYDRNEIGGAKPVDVRAVAHTVTQATGAQNSINIVNIHL